MCYVCSCYSPTMWWSWMAVMTVLLTSCWWQVVNPYSYQQGRQYQQHQNSNGIYKCGVANLFSGCSCSGPYTSGHGPGLVDLNTGTGAALHVGARHRGVRVVCVNVKRQQGLAELVTSLSESKVDKSSLYMMLVDEVTYGEATTILTYTGGRLTSVDDGTLSGLVNLLSLNLTNNKIRKLSETALASVQYVEVIDLSFNLLTELRPKQFSRLYQLMNLSVAHNLLHTLPEKLFFTNDKLSYVRVGGNSWYCDDQLVWLDNWLKESSERHLVDASRPVCSNSSVEAEVGVPLRTGLRNIVIRKEINNSHTCQRLCTCHPENGFPIVDCSNRGLTEFPRNIPKHTRNVYLNNNRIVRIKKSVVTSETWKQIHLLDLRNNSIESINQLEGTKLLRSLGALDLSHNAISHVPIYLLKQMKTIQVLRFSGNPWKCDCNTVVFQNWLQERHSRVKDWDNVRCWSGGKYANKAIYTMQKTVLCVRPAQVVHYLDVVSIVMAIMIVVIVTKVVYDYCQQKRTGQLPTFSKLL